MLFVLANKNTIPLEKRGEQLVSVPKLLQKAPVVPEMPKVIGYLAHPFF